ncbi:MAG: pyridoxamine 5'-phosphate oxidase family protein [Candidatus Heimdallarchaeaceae archaeon]
MKDLKQKVKEIIKKNSWCVLSTANSKGNPQSSVIMYQSDGNAIYFTSGEPTLKARNMRKNNNVSITIPFWKNTFHKFIPAPPAELHFRGKVEFLDRNHEEIQTNLKRFLDFEEKTKMTSEYIYLKVTPGKKIATFGVGIKLLQMRKPEKARNIVEWD